jgi:hypothetical protein
VHVLPKAETESHARTTQLLVHSAIAFLIPGSRIVHALRCAAPRHLFLSVPFRERQMRQTGVRERQIGGCAVRADSAGARQHQQGQGAMGMNRG